MEYGDNFPGIYSKGDLYVDDIVPELSCVAPDQKLILAFNGENYSSNTNSSGFAKFTIPLKSMIAGNYSFIIRHPESNTSTYIETEGTIEIIRNEHKFIKQTENDEKSTLNDDNNSNHNQNYSILNEAKKDKSKILSSNTVESSDMVIYSDNPHIILKTISSSKNKSHNALNTNDVGNMFFGLFKDYSDGFYKKFPYAKNRDDSNLLFTSYLYKEFSHSLLANINIPLNVYSFSLAIALYTVGAFSESYVLCNGSILGFFDYPFFHDPRYSKFMDDSFGEFSPWVKGAVEFAIGIDKNGNMSIMQFLINILCLCGPGIYGRLGTKIDKLYRIIRNNPIGKFFPKNFLDLINYFNDADVTLQLINNPYMGFSALSYKFFKFFSNKFEFIPFLSKGSKNKILVSAKFYIDEYINTGFKSFLDLFSIDYLNLASNLKKNSIILAKYARPKSKNKKYIKGNKSVYNENKKVQKKFFKKIISTTSKLIPKKLKRIIKFGIKVLRKQLRISKFNKTIKNKKLRVMSKNMKTVFKKVNNSKSKKKYKNNKIIKKIKNKAIQLINKPLQFFK